LNSVYQLNILNVTETNFFGINDILKNNNLSIYNNLTSILRNHYKLNNNKSNDEISLSAKFYLGNSEFGNQIEELYEQIDKKEFLYLNLEKLKQILYDNLVFDEDEFIKDLKDILYNSNLEVQKELKIEKEKYIDTLEEEIINNTYTKEEISIKINKNYKTGVKSLELSQINDINKNINDILDKIKQEFSNEAKLLKESSNLYNKDFTKIQERLKNYKAYTIENVKANLFYVINTFLQNINDKIYTNYYVSGLDEFISQAKKITSTFGEIKLLSDSYNAGEIIYNKIKDIAKGYKDFFKNEIKSNYNEIYLDIKKIYENQNWEKLIIEKIDESYNLILFPVLKEVAKYDIGISGYNAYDLNDNIIKDINEIIHNKINNIKNIMDSTKGYNFEIDIDQWKKMDFSLVYNKINSICKSFFTFVLCESDSEKEKIDNFSKDLMISNFNKLSENFMSSLGNRFLERIINYNKNFKISSLYDNLEYSLIPTIAYYNSLYISSKINTLMKDLKIKIYNLNDLDITILEKNKEVMNLLNKEIYEFIKDSQRFLVNKYNALFKNNTKIEQSFNDIIREKIIKNLYELEDNFNDNYLKLMNNYFKDKLISSYSNIMEQKASEIVYKVNNARENLKSKLDNLFSLESDIVLNEINNKINNTLYSINIFNSHFNTFQISKDLEDFLYNFGTKNIQPTFNGIMEVLPKGIIFLNKTLEYKNNYDNKEFIEKARLTFEEIKNKFINNINDAIDNYGKGEEYQDNLEKEINRQLQIIYRRLNQRLTEEEIENEYKGKIGDKTLDETLSKILISSKYAKRFIDNYENFDIFDKIINDNINKLNIAYKKSLKIIKDNQFTEEISNDQYNIIFELKELTMDYFLSINQSFYHLKEFLKYSINDINNNINKCANLTYITFLRKYENLPLEADWIYCTEENLGEISDSILVENQNKITKVKYTISQIIKKAQMKFDIEFDEEEGIKKPKISVSIINEITPKKIEFQFINRQESVGYIIEKVNIEPSNVNFRMSVNYSVKSKDLHVTTFSDFESYNIDIIQKVEKEICKNNYLAGICYVIPKFSEISPKKIKTIPRKTFFEEFILYESYIFKE